ncbi:hypothetical protein TNCV_1358221 [Trichonephila clavipes]|uniref:Uncharacterized protein n=1 Tax=Trichonephila clavipes TaxID=2585209 RepID=A0A8X6S9Z9_TRICX|nr:hypothetical protein TNCV_1358221 [Trichonephila clavipes]
MSHFRSRNLYQHISDVDKGRMVTYGDYSLSYRSTAARVGRDSMTVSRIWNRWVQDELRVLVVEELFHKYDDAVSGQKNHGIFPQYRQPCRFSEQHLMSRTSPTPEKRDKTVQKCVVEKRM